MEKFDNQIFVLDINGQEMHPTYLRRARGLVKNGRAEWLNDKTIQLLFSGQDDSKQLFLQYLNSKGKKQSHIDEYAAILEKLPPPVPAEIGEFMKSALRSGGTGGIKMAYQCLEEYAVFCEEELSDEFLFADAFREHVREYFEGEARRAVDAYRQAMVPVPADCQINPGYLARLSNKEFVAAFHTLQEFVAAVYDDIRQGSPFEWGWPNWRAIEVYGINHNRVAQRLEALAAAEIDYDTLTLTVEKKQFYAYGVNKPKEPANTMLNGFMKHGLHIEGPDDKKSTVFKLSYPANPHVIVALYEYFKPRYSGCNDCGENCSGCYRGYTYDHLQALSYRFVETAQAREPYWLALTDGMPRPLRDIQYYLYDEAAKHGYSFAGMYYGSITYVKGAKRWLHVRHQMPWGEQAARPWVNNYNWAVRTNLDTVLETQREEAAALIKKFPQEFDRIKDGKDTALYFCDVGLDDVKEILRLFKLENKIKPV